jgi:maleamate amidohydrolase
LLLAPRVVTGRLRAGADRRQLKRMSQIETVRSGISVGDIDMAREGELDVYKQQGFGNRLGFGVSPALVVIDFTRGFADADVLGGGNINLAIANTSVMLKAARGKDIPIAFTRHVYASDGSNFGLFNVKLPTNNLLRVDSPLAEIVPELAPLTGELVIDKQYPSAFVGTNLASWLTCKRVDTLIITGCTTSGCVRASAVDAMCNGFRPIVVRDCVGDRAEAPHEANLFDLDQKYADVVSSNEVLVELDRVLALRPSRG